MFMSNHESSDPQPRAEPCGTACCAPVAPLTLQVRPVELPQSASALPHSVARTAIHIMQMDCPTEEALLRQALGGLPGVHGMAFNLMQRVLTVAHEPDALVAVLTAIRTLGFTPELFEGTSTRAAVPAPVPWWPLALAGAAAMGSELVHWLGMPGWVAGFLAMVAVLVSGTSTFRKGWVAVRYGNFNINALMSLAVTGALLLGQWPEAAMVMVLFTLAERIEARSLDRARDAIQGLMRLAPELATVRQGDGQWREVAASEVVIGDRVRVRPGERIAFDGTLVSGFSSVNQSPITGESMPVDKAPGDVVFAGTVNGAGALELSVTAPAGGSTLARIIDVVMAAQGTRAPTQRFIDRFARIYTPVVLAVAVGVALLPPWLMGGDWMGWVYKALVLLVIACPCALVISTPVTIVSGLAAAARQGILIKSGAHLEAGRTLRWMALDKTGTLTEGRPLLTDVHVWAGQDEAAVRSLATSLAARSDHPVSHAVAASGLQAGLPVQEVSDFEALPGRGVRGEIAGQRCQLGNDRLAREHGHGSPELSARVQALEAQGKTVVVLTGEAGVLALFGVTDTLKESSREAIAELQGLGVRTLMLTGDNEVAARAVGVQVGIDEVLGGLLPEDKLRAIETRLSSQGAVGMVGDGINDAPALARADIGFAMGAAGTATAIETADVALMDDDLRKLPRFVRLSRRTHALLIQNIVLALSIKLVFLALTLMGLGTMWMAVFADVGASLLVVGNGLRLLRVTGAR